MNDVLPGNNPAVPRFRNREEAAFRLARALEEYRDPRSLVLGIPRGGVILGRMIAERLGGDFDVVLLRELSGLDQPELSIGAVTEYGPVFVNGAPETGASESSFQGKVEEARSQLRQQRDAYTPHRSASPPTGRRCILVDDGIATDPVLTFALRSLRRAGAERVVVAIPVVSSGTFEMLRGESHDVICLQVAKSFHAASEFFDDFSEVTEEEVLDLLRRASEGPEGYPGRPVRVHHGNCGFHPTRPAR